ncbi:kinase-like domain-containing protein [Gautieria morchelliformis]|nr:kinase-like domain-containing protein [Gautieria morchelliformis]
MNPLDISDALTSILASNIRDVTSEVQLLGDLPVAVTHDYSIWPGKLKESTDVAIKLLRPARTTLQQDLLREFVREAILWSRATHRNVVPLLGVARLDNSVAFVSLWMPGGELADYLILNQDAHVEQLFADVACGLAHLHTLGIVYGMLRSSTVLVSDTGRACLSSFLLAHTQMGSEFSPAEFEMLKWRINVHVYSEEAYGEGQQTTTSLGTDVFAFGTLIVETLRDRYATFSDSLDDDHLLRPPGLSDGLWDIVLCCEKEPEERLDMIEVARRMVKLAGDSVPTSNIDLLSLRSSFLYSADRQTLSRTLTDITREVRRLGEHPIAGGGYGDLYLGERLGSEKVALKLIRFYGASKQDKDAARRRFLSEAWLWAEFDHPRILKFYGVCEHGNLAYFMVSPFLENGNIIDYLAHMKPNADRRQLLREAAEGLLYLHTRAEPVVHGDIKGANILITDSGSAVLADFGLSKISHQETTTALQGAGSPRWMAPELILTTDTETGPVKSLKSDVYAFGHAMLEVYSNKVPFFNIKEDLHVLIELIHGRRSSKPDGPIADTWLDDEAWEFSRRCTSIKPEDRPDINAVVLELGPRVSVRTSSSRK